jgi:hypothetical protein
MFDMTQFKQGEHSNGHAANAAATNRLKRKMRRLIWGGGDGVERVVKWV